ncbi:nucleotidyltransferase domain-containing protein [Radiobacillus kanasensis]|uniref:nucleotidyltransferase domain-containing protein n=1 Tax=Radiobacillus kanasensis TaxID=2844358 RepID=UPI001E524FAB|nr:nucleotidyltransferase domain-containing protein [Radiobacillus kanasensis]UFU00107.1 nucleotidyltransferase domain-containing protein [Radiobacillus kanasensis]
MSKPNPTKAAHQFVEKYFPDCQGALLAGSTVRGEYTATSDLDIVIFDTSISQSYRESRFEFGWPVEVFVHNLTSYRQFFESDKQRARPSMPRMIAEAITLKDTEVIQKIQEEAQQLLDDGPEEWTADIIETKRYFITDALDDFIGSSVRAEELFIANSLAELISEFVLRTNRRWIGASKWIVRSLKHYDEEFTERFVEAFDTFYRTGDKHEVIKLADDVLKPFGGRLFEGFSLGKSK